MFADDLVMVQSPAQSTPVPWRGRILDYTGEFVTIRVGAMATEKTFSTKEIVRVEPDYEAPHVRGRELFPAGKIREAEEQFAAALEEEERPWVRRELLAALVRCALFEDDLRRAALRFMPIVESDPRSMHWGLIPLVWDVDAVKPPTEAEARSILAAGGKFAPLLAASWNLERNGQRNHEAEFSLQTLARDADPYLQRFAQMQLWRVRLATNAVTSNELRRWESAADDLPPSLRAGAHMLIGRGMMQQKDALRATAEWMWLPLQHADHRGLAAWGQLRAAEATLTAGDVPAAQTLAREVLQRFPGSTAIPHAEMLLRNVQTPP